VGVLTCAFALAARRVHTFWWLRENLTSPQSGRPPAGVRLVWAPSRARRSCKNEGPLSSGRPARAV